MSVSSAAKERRKKNKKKIPIFCFAVPTPGGPPERGAPPLPGLGRGLCLFSLALPSLLPLPHQGKSLCFFRERKKREREKEKNRLLLLLLLLLLLTGRGIEGGRVVVGNMVRAVTSPAHVFFFFLLLLSQDRPSCTCLVQIIEGPAAAARRALCVRNKCRPVGPVGAPRRRRR